MKTTARFACQYRTDSGKVFARFALEGVRGPVTINVVVRDGAYCQTRLQAKDEATRRYEAGEDFRFPPLTEGERPIDPALRERLFRRHLDAVAAGSGSFCEAAERLALAESYAWDEASRAEIAAVRSRLA